MNIDTRMNTDKSTDEHRLKIWIKAIRAPFFTATIVPVTFGSILAWHDTAFFAWFKFWLVMLGVLLIHTGTNLANDYFDHLSGCDEANSTPTPFSGGSRVIQDGLISPRNILYVALASFILGSGIGLYLNHLCAGNVILVLGVMGVFLGFFYSAVPFRIGYGGLGELAVGMGFGPLIILGSYYVQAQAVPLNVILASVPVAILITLVLFINEFPDYNADKSAGKRTLVVVMGKKQAVLLYHSLLTGVYLCIAILAALGTLPLFCLIAFFSLPLAFRAFEVSEKNFNRVYELLPANAATIGLHSAVGLLLSAGLVIDKFV